jgi:uncharacterized protein
MTHFSKKIFVNIPVSNIKQSILFYESLGFSLNTQFTDYQNAACLVWSEHIFVMILSKEYFQTFLQKKTVGDTHKYVAAALCISLESKDAVQKFAATAQENGGHVYANSAQDQDNMFGLSVEDPDGNLWEPMWMDMGEA